MRYKLIRDEETEQVKRLESGGETIYAYEGGGFSIKNEEFLEAIIDDANFGQPQKDALKAIVGLIETEYE